MRRSAESCFARNRHRIDGILVCLPNFGDEKGVADAIRLSEFNVPILVQACPDDLDQFGLARRRDAFCGKISVCNNLRQYGYKFSLTRDHTTSISSDRFQGGPEELLRSLPRGARVAPRAHRRSGRAAQRLQHDAIQREAA